MNYNLPVILGRAEHGQLIETLKEPTSFFKEKKVLITGSEGSLGTALQDHLRWSGAQVVTVDVVGMATVNADITGSFDLERIGDIVSKNFHGNPDYIYHLAADKHAPHAELDPSKTVEINIEGLQNMMRLFPQSHMILASTCKAADPETVYGATKMIGERIVLDTGGSVARFYNVPETQGNVFQIWNTTPSDNPLKVMPCQRYFISKAEATALLVAVPQITVGRYTIGGVVARSMIDIASALYPDRELKIVEQRRGDRTMEPLKAASEELKPFYAGISRVESIHDKPV